MSLLDLLETVGRARKGTRAIVAEPFDVVNADNGGTITLPIGTMIQITSSNGQSLSAIAEVNSGLCSVYLFAKHYPMLAMEKGK